MTLSTVKLSISTGFVMTPSKKTLSTITLRIITISLMKLGIITLSIITLSIKIKTATRLTDTV